MKRILLTFGTVLIAIGVMTTPVAVFAYDNLSLGEEITIYTYNPTDYGYSDLDGTFSIAIDGFHYMEELSEYQEPGIGVVGVLCSVNNIDAYQSWDGQGISSYGISLFLSLKDADGYNCEFYNMQAAPDGKYHVGANIDKGSKERVCMTYLIDTEIKDYSIVLNDEYIMNVSLDENGEGVFREVETVEDAENGSEVTEETPEKIDESLLENE